MTNLNAGRDRDGPPAAFPDHRCDRLECSLKQAVSITFRSIRFQPEFLGVGLEPEEVLALHRQHAHFTVMKGEGPVVVVKRFLDLLGDEVAVFNGRGGLELPDNLRAGCAGMIPAPDCADVQIAIYEALRRGDLATADALYARILPYVVFIMQSVSFMVRYGKPMFARRIGLPGDAASRVADLAEDPFFVEALERWARGFGDYGAPAPG